MLEAPVKEIETRIVLVNDRPVTFDEFLDRSTDGYDVELVGGVMVERMAAQLDHERLFWWFGWILRGYVNQKRLGEVLGSRTAVKITGYDGRLPDLLFVRQERAAIIEDRAVNGPPDLVVEILSPGDYPSDQAALETDYRSIGVSEIMFVDRRRRRVLLVRRRDEGYESVEVRSGDLRLESIPGFHLQAEWLFDENRPDDAEVLAGLLAEELK